MGIYHYPKIIIIFDCILFRSKQGFFGDVIVIIRQKKREQKTRSLPFRHLCGAG
jgi:hypothetical protein